MLLFQGITKPTSALACAAALYSLRNSGWKHSTPRDIFNRRLTELYVTYFDESEVPAMESQMRSLHAPWHDNKGAPLLHVRKGMKEFARRRSEEVMLRLVRRAALDEKGPRWRAFCLLCLHEWECTHAGSHGEESTSSLSLFNHH